MKKDNTPQILIISGSDSDLPFMEECTKLLKRFNVSYQLRIASAHRSPEKVRRLVTEAEKKGTQVIIAAAGGAAHLPGVIASFVTLPVIGVPISNPPFSGLDALYSILQMPGGIPVATMAVGKSGALNAAILACQILAVCDRNIRTQLKAYKKELSNIVEEKDKAVYYEQREVKQ